MKTPDFSSFWAKTDREDENQWHSLFGHMVDSGLVARTLWMESLSNSFKEKITQTLSLEVSQAGDLLSFWVSLHDIGKAGPHFQRKWDPGKQRVRQAGFEFPPGPEKIPGFHGLTSTWILRDYWKENRYAQVQFCHALAVTLGGHHGEFPSNEDVLKTTYQKHHLGDGLWENARNLLITEMERIFHPPARFSIPSQRDKSNALLLLIAGLTTIADWIASDSSLFPYDNGVNFSDSYIDKAQSQARAALEGLGWCGWRADGELLSFEDLFPKYEPSELQKRFIQETEGLSSPFLAILEAPTGSGKTEMALHLGDRILQKEYKSGFFIAMPTMATSNQMFERTVDFLSRRYSSDDINVQLIHGASIINEKFQKIRMRGIAQDNRGEFGHVTASDWFLPHKKSLLAPFGIGTVDQSFLAVMRSKHFFLRLFGLAHKVIIFDEVHAYDVYMMEIFRHLLAWLREIDTSVIILSATLPGETRRELLEVYASSKMSDDDQQIEFPRLSISSGEGIRSVSLGSVNSRVIKLQWANENEIISVLNEKLAEGGNAALICNRVDAVIELYEKLLEHFPREELVVFHSRFPFCWREKTENNIKKRYGKDFSKRPQCSIVIATQVIEQSLDLDFDLMVSSLAPVDLLIQRVGRLQRHQQAVQNPNRPDAVANPMLMLIKPQLENTLPDFGKDVYIYEPYILQRTWFLLQNQSEICLPEQTDDLIETVYSDRYDPVIPAEVWSDMQEFFRKMIHTGENDELKASNQLLPYPERRILGSFMSGIAGEHDPASLSVMHTLTRNAPPSVQLVCLIRTDQGLFTLDKNLPIDLEDEPDFRTVAACLRSSIAVSNWLLIKYFFECEVPAAWKNSAALRNRIPVIFENGVYQANGFVLILDDEKGLIISK